MKLSKIKILQFRNLSRVELSGFSDVNLLIGQNAAGKTNFLEALYLLSASSPFRKVTYRDLVQKGKDYFFCGGDFDGNAIEIGYSEKKRVLKFCGEKIKKNDLRLKNPVVAFLPSDLEMVIGSPVGKRGFLDETLLQVDPSYAEVLSRFERALKQRNAQLKIDPASAKIWNSEFLKWGSLVISARLSLAPKFSQSVRKTFSDLYDQEVQFKYFNNFKIPGGKIEESLSIALKESGREEKFRRHTLVGPQRDNFELFSGEQKPIQFASQGQLRTLSVLLRAAQANFIRENAQENPILLFDDVFLELDQTRRVLLAEKLFPNFQVFLTMTSEDLLPEISGRRFSVQSGRILTV